MEEPTTKTSAIILFDENLKVLLQHRDNDPTIHNPNAWDFFGGHIEEGESPTQAVMREAREELKFNSDNMKYWFKVYHDSSLHYYFFERITEDMKASLVQLEGDNMGWFSVDDAMDLDYALSGRKALLTLSYMNRIFSNEVIAHEMHLYDNPFNLISSGSSSVEFRLFDEKRKKVKIGDTITFSHMYESKKKVKVKVIDMIIGESFELFSKRLSPKELSCADTPEARDNWWKGFEEYYTKEDEDKYGVCGIVFEIIDGVENG